MIELAPNVHYDPDAKGYIMLDVPVSELPLLPLDDGLMPDLPSLTLDDKLQLKPKKKYHCSLVAARKLAGEDPEREARIVELARSQLAIETVAFGGLAGNIYVCQKPDDDGRMRTTVIASARVFGLEGLTRVLRQEVSGYQPTFPHITLYASDRYGIGVNSAEQLAAYCRLRNDLRPIIFPDWEQTAGQL